jgi:hypothetical protein
MAWPNVLALQGRNGVIGGRKANRWPGVLAAFALDDAGFDDATVNKFAKGDATLADFKALETSVKGKIDSTASTQQMDMLRMQSLNNKRNEAYDIMTNWLKNIQDKKSTIIGNMR